MISTNIKCSKPEIWIARNGFYDLVVLLTRWLSQCFCWQLALSQVLQKLVACLMCLPLSAVTGSPKCLNARAPLFISSVIADLYVHNKDVNISHGHTCAEICYSQTRMESLYRNNQLWTILWGNGNCRHWLLPLWHWRWNTKA